MSTPVAERVRQFRERRRQANPKAPFWSDLTGKLNVAATWLGLGNPAPDSFADALRAVAAKIGLKVAEEPPAAAEEPYQPKGIQARVAAIFEPLATQLIAQLPARSQPKFRRNLDKFLADLKHDCQRLVRDEIVDGVIERRDRWVAHSAFTTTCDPEAVDRDVERSFGDFYRQMRDFKRVLSAHHWRKFQRPFDDFIQLIGRTCQINLPVELDRRIKAEEQAKMEHLCAELAKHKRERYLPGMTEEDFKLIRGLLHPDKHLKESEEAQERYARAFDAFNRLGLMVTWM